MKTHRLSGSVLIIALCIITLLLFIAGTAIGLVMNNRSALNQAVSWQEALMAAEAGIHQATAQVQSQLLPQLNQDIPADLTGSQTFNIALSHAGEGNQTTGAEYVITGTNVSVGAGGAGRLYFRVVSTGTAAISGPKSFPSSSQDPILRKLNLGGTSIQTATRQVETWLTPSYSQDTALATNGLIHMNNHNITVDSFNSQDPNRSVSGQPSPILGFFNSQQINRANGGTMVGDHMNASVGTNSTLAMLGNSYIYGDAMTNGGVVTNPGNVFGTISSDFSQPMSAVLLPNASFSYPSDSNNSTITYIKNNKQVVLHGGSKANPARYQLDSVSLTGNSALTFSLGKTGTTANTNLGYVELYVTGDLTCKGGGMDDGHVVIDHGVNVKIYVGGNIAIGGNGIVNNNNTANTLSILGITPTDGSTRTANFGGSSIFYGTIYAPDYDITLGGTPTYVGSIVGKTATLVGNVSIRYDESLGGAGMILRFATASWFENIKKVP